MKQRHAISITDRAAIAIVQREAAKTGEPLAKVAARIIVVANAKG